MDLNPETVVAFVKGLELRYEWEKMNLQGVENVEIRLYNHTTGEQAARFEFLNNALTRIDFWDLKKKTIELIEWE